MAKQLDLFGKVVKTPCKSVAHVYSNPATPYEQFVERYYEQQHNCHPRTGKADILKDAQEQWKSKFSKDKSALDAFLELKEGERPFQDKDIHVGEQLCDFGFCRVTTMQNSSSEVNILACPALSFQKSSNIASSFNDIHMLKVMTRK